MDIKYELNSMKNDAVHPIPFLSSEEINKARTFHQSFAEYKPTPLVSLQTMAKRVGVKGLYVKDESYRMGLNAFKVLGGSYAIGKYIAKKLGKDITELPYETMISDDVKQKLGNITFTTTTDGNHGRGIAWTAKRLQQHAVIYMPKGTQEIRLKNIQNLGAEAEITDLNYDDAVRYTSEQAKKNGWVVVQDTAWEGYTEIPTWIMQGYGTLALEAYEQLQNLGVEEPTHIFLQAGVGSFAGAVQGFFTNTCKQNPVSVVVEAEAANCLYKSACLKDGEPHAVGGDLSTIMAGLACGEANTIGWEVLRDNSTAFVSCPDWVSANGMRILGNPDGNDDKVVSGESGAVSAGLFVEIMTNPELADLRKKLELNENSQVLIFSTEGDTDPEMYRKIVWDGIFSKPNQ